MVAHGYDLGVVGIAVGVHVAGMFAPSSFSGRLADRIDPTHRREIELTVGRSTINQRSERSWYCSC